MCLFAFIMACVILILSVAPCADVKDFSSKNTAIVENATQQSNKLPHSDACSPLCICSCCAGCSMYYLAPQLPQIIEYTVNIYSDFIPACIIKITLPIWLPPQL